MEEEFKRLGIEVEYEMDKIKYTLPETHHTYTPDWKLLEDGSYIETKGKWSQQDRAKMVYLQKTRPDLKIRMLFQRGKNTISRSSKTTYMDFCHKNNIDAADYATEGIPERWYK